MGRKEYEEKSRALGEKVTGEGSSCAGFVGTLILIVVASLLSWFFTCFGC